MSCNCCANNEYFYFEWRPLSHEPLNLPKCLLPKNVCCILPLCAGCCPLTVCWKMFFSGAFLSSGWQITSPSPRSRHDPKHTLGRTETRRARRLPGFPTLCTSPVPGVEQVTRAETSRMTAGVGAAGDASHGGQRHYHNTGWLGRSRRRVLRGS